MKKNTIESSISLGINIGALKINELPFKNQNDVKIFQNALLNKVQFLI